MKEREEDLLKDIQEDEGKEPSIPQIAEAGFCIIYLIYGIIIAAIFAMRCYRIQDISWGNGRLAFICFIMTGLLVAGDSFHLVPRIINAFSKKFEKYEFWAGLGLLTSSVTMTFFYDALYSTCYRTSHTGNYIPALKYILWALTIIRILLCLFPQNNWFKKEGNMVWAIIRNVPFVIIGIIMVVICAIIGFGNLAIAIVISFACYLPVVLFAKKNPKLGMLMIPKTIAYMYIITFVMMTF